MKIRHLWSDPWPPITRMLTKGSNNREEGLLVLGVASWIWLAEPWKKWLSHHNDCIKPWWSPPQHFQGDLAIFVLRNFFISTFGLYIPDNYITTGMGVRLASSSALQSGGGKVSLCQISALWLKWWGRLFRTHTVSHLDYLDFCCHLKVSLISEALLRNCKSLDLNPRPSPSLQGATDQLRCETYVK